MALTKKQKLVFDYISEYIDLNGYSPTQMEIKNYFGFKSLGSVQDYIHYLTNAGYLKNGSNTVRGLEPAHKVSSVATSLAIPLLGHVAAGAPIETFEQSETITVPQEMIKKGEFFALQIQGNSMIEDGIFDNDIVVIKKQNTANRGETIVATIDDCATIKKYQPNKNFIELMPANETLKPIKVLPHENFAIKGILVGLIRRYT